MAWTRAIHWRNRLSLAIVGTGLLTSATAADPYAGLPELPEPIPTTRPLTVRVAPGPVNQQIPQASMRYAGGAVDEVRPMEASNSSAPGGCSTCGQAPCPPYLRNRPEGHQRQRIKLYNRQNEPNWYHYYRCCHYGYHPTQWQAWPENWLTCRHPQPGAHPYDYYPTKPDKKQLDRERRLLEGRDADRAEPGRLDEDPLPPPVDAPPRPLPPENSTPMPEVDPLNEPLPMP